MIGRGKTVLVVDAAEAMRQMLGAALRALAVQGLKLDGLLVKPVSRDVLGRTIASAFSPAKAAPTRFPGQAA